MPTQYRRVGVTLDPKLQTALTASRCQLHADSAAGGIRELALIGAAHIQARDDHARNLAEVDRWLDSIGASKADGDLVEVSGEILARNANLPDRNERGETMAEALAWVQGKARGF